jgi:hypothetical protein
MTWQLSLEAYRLAGKIDEDEPRLRRSVVRLRRLRNKRALGRKKDLADVEELERGKRRVSKRARGTRRKRGT